QDSDEESVRKSKCPEKVILVGHSVGAYVMLEVIRRWKLSTQGFSPETSTILEIIGGILLFPTVTNIAKSPSGKWISVSSPELLLSTLTTTFFFKCYIRAGYDLVGCAVFHCFL